MGLEEVTMESYVSYGWRCEEYACEGQTLHDDKMCLRSINLAIVLQSTSRASNGTLAGLQVVKGTTECGLTMKEGDHPMTCSPCGCNNPRTHPHCTG